MTFPFNPGKGLVVLAAEVTGPSGSTFVRLALDTGATRTLINVAPLVTVGYDPALATKKVKMTMAGGITFVPRLPLLRINALGQDRTNFPILCHTLPPGTGVDGVLGLDFVRGHILTLDFLNGQITLV